MVQAATHDDAAFSFLLRQALLAKEVEELEVKAAGKERRLMTLVEELRGRTDLHGQLSLLQQAVIIWVMIKWEVMKRKENKRKRKKRRKKRLPQSSSSRGSRRSPTTRIPMFSLQCPARFVEAVGACADMALVRIPAVIRVEKGVARMSVPQMKTALVDAVSFPAMVEAQTLLLLVKDCVDECEVLATNEGFLICMNKFEVPYVCGYRDFGEALRRIAEGAG